MNFYKFNLLLTSVLLIVIYFKIPFYEEWLLTKAASPNNNMFEQMQNLDIKYRYQYRFGSDYMVYKDMQRILSTHKDVVLLLPTTEYLRSVNITNVNMSEPATFYYYTGLKSVWANSPDVEKANWAFVASKKTGMRVVDIKSKPQLDSLITSYKKFAN